MGILENVITENNKLKEALRAISHLVQFPLDDKERTLDFIEDIAVNALLKHKDGLEYFNEKLEG